ncbi:SRPBCC family protein [Brevundimonas bacteroides]|uniref:hypothetical protein n=1 Tax=Brevundimonas bacteroides TaxID=74311 RepID=UPI00068A1BB7|nr:hypothetical protein [Brevundimonas bacteroides]
MFRPAFIGLGLSLLAVPAGAEIVSRSETGFSLSFERSIAASPEAVLEAVGHPERWWSSAHTYSGDAANISLDLRPGGCWCEALPGGGVKHGEAVLVWPDRSMARFDAPFGPLQGIGADAVLTMTWTLVEGQAERRLRWTFVVNGPGSGAMADPVHGVMEEQFSRLVNALESGD